MKTEAVYHGFEIIVELLEVNPPSAVGGYTITASDPQLEERMHSKLLPTSRSIPMESIDAPGGVDVGSWATERFFEMARERVDQLLEELRD